MSNDTEQYKILTTTHVFVAPRELIWDTLTKPEHFVKWYSPDQFTIPVCEFDLREGGNLRIDMQGPDGTLYPSSGVFKEVVKPSHLAFTNSPLDVTGNKLFEILHTLVLTEEGGKTKLELSSQVLSAGPEAAPYLAGMEAGLKQAIEKLDQLVRSLPA